VFLEDILWHFFKTTGQIGAYLFYKEFHEIKDQQIMCSKEYQPTSTPEGIQKICDVSARGGPN